MSLRLRAADAADRDLLFEWANDGLVRANAFHTERIPYERHVRWFEKIMADADVLQYILCDGDVPVGQLRLNIEGTTAWIDYSIAPGQRKKGYGGAMLCMMQEQLAADKTARVTKAIGQVKYKNHASARAFERCGFVRRELPEYLQYEWDVQK